MNKFAWVYAMDRDYLECRFGKEIECLCCIRDRDCPNYRYGSSDVDDLYGIGYDLEEVVKNWVIVSGGVAYGYCRDCLASFLLESLEFANAALMVYDSSILRMPEEVKRRLVNSVGVRNAGTG
jgi:hypothetical protein